MKIIFEAIVKIQGVPRLCTLLVIWHTTDQFNFYNKIHTTESRRNKNVYILYIAGIRMTTCKGCTYILSPLPRKNDGVTQVATNFTEMYMNQIYISQEWHQWPNVNNQTTSMTFEETNYFPFFSCTSICVVLFCFCEFQYITSKK